MSNNPSTSHGPDSDDDRRFHLSQHLHILIEEPLEQEPTGGEDIQLKPGTNIIENTKEKLLQKLVPDTTMLFRAVNHKNRLAKMKRNPFSLQIKAVAQGVHTETPEFRAKWQEAIYKCEKILYDTLTNHLSETAEFYKKKIEGYCQIAKNNFCTEMSEENADLLVGDIIQKANDIRKKKEEEQEKKKQDNKRRRDQNEEDPNPSKKKKYKRN